CSGLVLGIEGDFAAGGDAGELGLDGGGEVLAVLVADGDGCDRRGGERGGGGLAGDGQGLGLAGWGGGSGEVGVTAVAGGEAVAAGPELGGAEAALAGGAGHGDGAQTGRAGEDVGRAGRSFAGGRGDIDVQGHALLLARRFSTAKPGTSAVLGGLA